MRTKQLILTIVIFSLFLVGNVSYSSEINNQKAINQNQINSYDSTNLDESNVRILKDYLRKELSIEPNAALSGTQYYAVICAQFKNMAATRYNIPQITAFWDTLSDFWVNASSNKININYHLHGWYILPKTYAEYNNSVGQFKYEIIDSAIDLADDDIDYSIYDHVLVIVNNVWYRGISSLSKNHKIDNNGKNVDVSITLVAENPGDSDSQVWGRWAHEMGHSLGLEHTHGSDSATTKNYASWYSLMARAYPSGLNGYEMYWKGKTNWYDQTQQLVIVQPGHFVSTYLEPRYYTDSETDDPQYIAVMISNARYYRVEVIEKKAEDACLPNEGVLIYYVDENDPIDDQCTDMDNTPGSFPDPEDDLWDCLYDEGDSFIDIIYKINITIVLKLLDRYLIEVTNEGTGFPDVMIRDWGNPSGSPPPYETPDIWVDSPINGYDVYRYYDPINGIEGIGDDPWVNHPNRLYARIHNIGTSLATNIRINFYQNIPMGAGDNGAWIYLGFEMIDYINVGDSVEVWTDYSPSSYLYPTETGLMKIHSCVYVEIEKITGEIDGGNNKAQENIGYFEVTSQTSQVKLPSSTFKPVNATLLVKNPLDRENDIFVTVLNVSEKWEVVGNGLNEFHTFAPLEEKEFEVQVIPGDEIRLEDKFEGYLFAGHTEEYPNSTNFVGDCHFVTIGGISLKMIAMYRSDLDLEAAVRAGNITLSGQISFLDSLPLAKFPIGYNKTIITFEIKNKDIPGSDYEYYTTNFNSNGEFSFEFDPLIPGNYSVTAYFGGTQILTTTKSVTLIIDSIHGIVSTKKFPGFEFWVVFCIFIITVIQIKKRIK